MSDDTKAQERRIRNRISSYESQKSGLQSEVGVLRAKVARLKEAYKNIDATKEDYREEKKALKRIYEEKYSWTGSNYDQFASDANTCKTKNDDFFKEVDRIQDEINRERARLENQIWEKDGMIGRLAGLINSCWTELRNLFN